MSARLLDGQFHAEGLMFEVRRAALALPLPPHLAIILFSGDPASERYVAKKVKAGVECGLTVDVIRPDNQDEAASAIAFLARDEEVHGIILQLPVPAGVDAAALIERIPAQKDVDGLREQSPYAPATVRAVEELLAREDVPLANATICIVGAKGAVGSRLAARWSGKGYRLLLADLDTEDLAALTQQADVLVSATGHPGLITPGHVREGAVVVDVGFTLRDGKIQGDVEPLVTTVASAISPVPGGVGPMTVACLLGNTVEAARRAQLPETVDHG